MPRRSTATCLEPTNLGNTPGSPGVSVTTTATPDGVAVFVTGRCITGMAPRSSAARRIPPHLDERTLYLLVSPLLGYGARELVQRLPRSSAVLAVEYEPELAGLSQGKESELPAALGLTVRFASTEGAAVHEGHGLIDTLGIRAVRVIHLTGGSRLHASAYRRLEELLQQHTRQFWINRGTFIRLGRRWISNMMRTLQLPHCTLDELAGSFSTPVILAGAGPSLTQHLPWITRQVNRGDAVLAALDTALPALAAAGVTPQIIWAMDGQLANAMDLLPWRWDRCTLAADVTTHPSIIRRFAPHRRFLFVTSLAHPMPLEGSAIADLPRIPPRGSVAPAALEGLVRVCGARHVVLAGIDFWYRPPLSHASMTAPHRMVLRQCTRLRPGDGDPRLLVRPRCAVQLQDGTTAPGDAVLHDQALQMRHLIAELKRDVPEVNISTLPRHGVDLGVAATPREISQDSEREGSRYSAPASAPREATRPGVSLEALLEQLVRQEQYLLKHPAGPLLVDADLRFALMDMPQWPLMEARQEWAIPHHHAVLRSIRDYRRRLVHATQHLKYAQP